MEKGVLCKYFFQQTFVETTSFPQENEIACLLLSSRPTLAEIRQKFPFQGTYHFRVLVNTINSSSSAYLWLDLTDPYQIVPLIQDGEIKIKVLQLSSDDSSKENPQMDLQEEQRFASFFRWQEQRTRGSNTNNNYNNTQDVGAVLKDVKKAFTSKMKFSATKMWEKAQNIANNMNNAGGSMGGGGGGGGMAPPSASALANLAKLVGALKANLSESNREHMDFLQRLWCTSNQLDPQSFRPRHDLWISKMGFHTNEPLRELQNLLTLQSLVFFHEVHSQIACEMLEDQLDQLGSSSDGDEEGYPYMTVANQVTLMLADLLSLKDGTCLGLERPFWRLFENGEQIGFYELFSIAMRTFDDSWKDQTNDISFHLENTRQFMMEILRRGPDSVHSLVDYTHEIQKWV